MIKYLKQLCLEDGISGDETRVLDKIISFLPKNCEKYVDPLGNLIVIKKGRKKPKHKLVLTAHMDEVGFIVTNILEDGFILFDSVGGIIPSTVAGSKVKISDNYGIIGTKAIHLLDKKEREKELAFDDLFIDIGAKSEKQARKYVSLGDSVTFVSDFVELGDNKVKCKAIDDRFGCSILLKLLNDYNEFDITCAFLVQEEVGLFGAKTATYSLDPQYAIVLDATTAADIDDFSDDKKVCCLNKGAVVPFMDRSTIYDKFLYDLALKIAKKNKIPTQPKSLIVGGNDAGSIFSSNAGVKTLSLSLPCRYIHSPSSLASIDDMKSIYKLLTLLISGIASIK